MFRKRIRRGSTRATSVALLAVVLAAAAAEARDVPMLVFGRGAAPIGYSVAPGVASPFGANGFAFPFGMYRGEDGVAITQSFDPVTRTGTFQGTFTFVNRWTGERLPMTFGDTENGAEQAGTFVAFPVGRRRVRVLFIAEFNPIVGESTGRFRRVTGGSLMMYALSDPIRLRFDPDTGFSAPFRFHWIGSGYLEIGNRRGGRGGDDRDGDDGGNDDGGNGDGDGGGDGGNPPPPVH